MQKTAVLLYYKQSNGLPEERASRVVVFEHRDGLDLHAAIIATIERWSQTEDGKATLARTGSVTLSGAIAYIPLYHWQSFNIYAITTDTTRTIKWLDEHFAVQEQE